MNDHRREVVSTMHELLADEEERAPDVGYCHIFIHLLEQPTMHLLHQ